MLLQPRSRWASDVHRGSTAASSPAPSAPMPFQPRCRWASDVHSGSIAASSPAPSPPILIADRSSAVTRHHSCSLPTPRSSIEIDFITAVCGALALIMPAPSLGIMLCGPCPAPARAACLALTLAAGFTRPIAARISFDTMPSIMVRSAGISRCMSSVGKSFIALSNGTGDLAHGLSFSSRKRVCSPSLSRSLDSISQPLALSALDSEASEAASWSSVASILVGFELGQGVGRTLGARRWCACACLRAGAGVRAPGGGAGVSCVRVGARLSMFRRRLTRGAEGGSCLT